MKISSLWVLHCKGGKTMHILARSQGSWVGGQAELQGEVNLSD